MYHVHSREVVKWRYAEFLRTEQDSKPVTSGHLTIINCLLARCEGQCCCCRTTTRGCGQRNIALRHVGLQVRGSAVRLATAARNERLRIHSVVDRTPRGRRRLLRSGGVKHSDARVRCRNPEGVVGTVGGGGATVARRRRERIPCHRLFRQGHSYQNTRSNRLQRRYDKIDRGGGSSRATVICPVIEAGTEAGGSGTLPNAFPGRTPVITVAA
jgi:hypothetical protein